MQVLVNHAPDSLSVLADHSKSIVLVLQITSSYYYSKPCLQFGGTAQDDLEGCNSLNPPPPTTHATLHVQPTSGLICTDAIFATLLHSFLVTHASLGSPSASPYAHADYNIGNHYPLYVDILYPVVVVTACTVCVRRTRGRRIAM